MFGVPKYEKIVIQVCIYILHMNITNIYILQVYVYIYIYISRIYIYYIWILTMFDLLLFLPANPYVVGSWDLQTCFFTATNIVYMYVCHIIWYIYIYIQYNTNRNKNKNAIHYK